MWGRVTPPVDLRQPRRGASPSQESIEVVCDTILPLFLGFLRIFVADLGFFQGIFWARDFSVTSVLRILGPNSIQVWFFLWNCGHFLFKNLSSLVVLDSQ